MAQLGKTLQEMADTAAVKAGIDPLAPSLQEYYEYAPKSPDGVIWWVYKSDEREKFEVENGWTLVRRTVKIKKGEWEDVE